jgi:hypothetical protein
MSALQANSPAAKWLKGLARVTAGGAARRMREAARLKALQRTPYPMVLARIKLLLDRLQVGPGKGRSNGERGDSDLVTYYVMRAGRCGGDTDVAVSRRLAGSKYVLWEGAAGCGRDGRAA